MIQNKTIHYWKLGRDELLLARRNPEIKKSRRRGVDMVQLYVLHTVLVIPREILDFNWPAIQ